jgi:hypothetical protein
LVVVDKNNSGKGSKAQSSASRALEEAGQAIAEIPADLDVQDSLTRARARRSQAESARQKIINEIMEASKALYQKLVEEGTQTLEKAKQLETDAELRHLEAQRELEHSNNIRSEADAYREKVTYQTQHQAQQMLRQAQAIKAEAIEFREKLLEQVKQQTRDELEQAQSERLDADAYRENIIAQTQDQAKEILDQARSTAERKGAEIVQRYSVEAERILSQAELIKAAAQEQLEAQKLYAEVADLETESRAVLERARAELGHEPSQAEDQANGEDHDKVEDPRPVPPLEDSNETLPSESLLKFGDNSDAEDPLLPGTVDSQTNEVENDSGDSTELCVSQEELPDNELVLGLEIGTRSKAYPLQVVTEAKVINDSLNHQDVLVTFGPPSELGMIFSRRVEGRSLTFQATSETANGLMLMRDVETGTTWEALTGRAISGPLVHAELKRIPYEYSFWFAWKDLHPQTGIYTAEQNVHAASVSQ